MSPTRPFPSVFVYYSKAIKNLTVGRPGMLVHLTMVTLTIMQEQW